MVGIVMIAPLVVAIVLGETDEVGNFLIGIGICLIAGNALRLLRIRPGKLTRRQAFLIVGLAWFVIALVISIPMFLSGTYSSLFDAVFDAVSALTTTGFSTADDYDHMAVSQQLLRLIMVFIGGQGIVVIGLSLGFFAHSGGLGTVFKSEGRTETVLPSVIETTRFIWIVASSMVLIGTTLGTIISLQIGMDFWRALYNGFFLAVSAYDTGGSTPQSSSLIYYHSWKIEALCMFLTTMGMINFAMYLHLARRGDHEFRRNVEARTTVVWIILSVIIMTLVLLGDGFYTTLPELFRESLFMVISACSTAGLQTVYSSQLGNTFTNDAMVILLIIMMVGGTSGSTAGGIKLIRVSIIGKSIWSSIKKSLRPASVVENTKYHQFYDRKLTNELAMQTMTIFILYVFTGIAGGMLGIAYGYEAIPSMFESFGCVSSTGLSVGIISMGTPMVLKVFYAFEMYAGRLEFITFIATFVELFISLFAWRPLAHRVKREAA